MAWLKRKWPTLVTLFLIFLFLYSWDTKYRVERHKEYLTELNKSVVPTETSIDFSNSSGLGRLNSSFCEVLVGSRGAVKKGEGYQVKLRIVNPSSITLSGYKITYSWTSYGMEKSAETLSANVRLAPGYSYTDVAFLSPLEGDALKSVSVKINFDYMSSY